MKIRFDRFTRLFDETPCESVVFEGSLEEVQAQFTEWAAPFETLFLQQTVIEDDREVVTE